MKITENSPDANFIMIAFNGELVGWVVEADDEAGYIIQVAYDKEAFERPLPVKAPFPSPIGHVKREGKVAFLGNTEIDDRDTILKRFNEHRKECGLPPYAEA